MGLSSGRAIPLKASDERTPTTPGRLLGSSNIRDALGDARPAGPRARQTAAAQHKFSRQQGSAESRRLSMVARRSIVPAGFGFLGSKDSFEAAQQTAAALNNKFRYRPTQSTQAPSGSKVPPIKLHDDKMGAKRPGGPASARSKRSRTREGSRKSDQK